MSENAAFTCRRCGHCCQGEGGIVLTERDVDRLVTHLGLTREAFLTIYTRRSGEKTQLKSRPDGACMFYADGCGVHPARPDICRAWPFFRGNLVDPVSHALAMDYCPGIHPEVPHAAFVREGKAYLEKEGLIRPRGGDTPEALADISVEDAKEPDHGPHGLDAS